MTLQNTDISARLWNPRAKGSEQPFRQGAICQQDQRTSDTRSQMRLRKCAGHLKRRKTCSPPVTACHSTWELLSRVLALWVNRANFCGVLTIVEMLCWSPHSLTFSRGTETVSSIAGLWILKWRHCFIHYRWFVIQKPVPPRRLKAPTQDCCSAFPEDPTWANRRAGICKNEEGQLSTCRWCWNLKVEDILWEGIPSYPMGAWHLGLCRQASGRVFWRCGPFTHATQCSKTWQKHPHTVTW